MLGGGGDEASDASERADLDAWARRTSAEDAAHRAARPVPAATQAPAASRRPRASDSDIASYRVTAQRVLDEHERSTAAPAGAPARVRFAPSPAAPARVTTAVAPVGVLQPPGAAQAQVDARVTQRAAALPQRRAASKRHHDDLVGLTGAATGTSAARAETEHAALDSGVAADGSFSGASVFVVCQHGALMGRANGLWQDFGGRRDGNESPYQTAFRELREEIGLTADHVDVLPDQPIWVVHAGYRHAVYVATLSEENRLRPDWNLGDEETPELDAYSYNFVDFANYFADDMFGYEMVHRRIKTREIFDLASSAYVDLCRAAHRAKCAARAADSSDSDDDSNDDGTPPPPPRKAVASTAARSASDVGRSSDLDGKGYIPSSVLALPPDAAATVADTATVLASAPARSSCAAAGRGLKLTNRSAAVTPAIAAVAASDVGRPGVVDGEGYIASPALGPPRGAAATADAPAVLAPAPVRFTRASARRERELVSRRTTAAQSLAPVIASDVGQPGAVDGEGYIASPALGLPQDAAATVADEPAVLAAGARALPVRRRRHDSRRTRSAAAPAAAIASVSASDVTTPIALDGEGYIPPSALGLPPGAAPTVADASAALATAPARVPRAAADRQLGVSALTSYHSGNA